MNQAGSFLYSGKALAGLALEGALEGLAGIHEQSSQHALATANGETVDEVPVVAAERGVDDLDCSTVPRESTDALDGRQALAAHYGAGVGPVGDADRLRLRGGEKSAHGEDGARRAKFA